MQKRSFFICLVIHVLLLQKDRKLKLRGIFWIWVNHWEFHPEVMCGHTVIAMPQPAVQHDSDWDIPGSFFLTVCHTLCVKKESLRLNVSAAHWILIVPALWRELSKLNWVKPIHLITVLWTHKYTYMKTYQSQNGILHAFPSHRI